MRAGRVMLMLNEMILVLLVLASPSIVTAQVTSSMVICTRSTGAKRE